MEFEFSVEDRLLRERIRAWLEEHVPREKRPHDGVAMRQFDLEWQRTRYRGGWGGIAWPREHGGCGLTFLQQIIWFEECGRAHAPPTGCLNIALSHGGPTLIQWGSEAQKAFHLPKILKGEAVWCQGFSEPDSGSDLASLRTRAAVEEDQLVVNGQKIWTSHAHLADYQILLARTDPASRGYRGLSWLILDMATPGIEVYPIDTLVPGNQQFCQVFFNDVRVPRSNVVGPLNDGWRVAMSTLTLERGMVAASHATELSQAIEDLIVLAKERTGPDGRRSAIEDEEIATRLAMHRSEAAALRALLYDAATRKSEGVAAGAEAALTFLLCSELMQRVRQTSVDIIGIDALVLAGEGERWTLPFLMDRMYQIAGGTTEVRRNIVAERLLGLPRSY